MELEVHHSSSSLSLPPFRKNVASLVSEPLILGRGRRLESQFEETTDAFEKMATSLRELYREQEMFFHECRHEQEAQERCLDARFDEVKKLILGLNLPNEGRSMATTDANSGSHCNFVPLECNLSPMQKTKELEISISLPQVEGMGFDSLETHDGGLDMHRSMATMDKDSDSHGSQLELDDYGLVEQYKGLPSRNMHLISSTLSISRESHEEGEPYPISITTSVQIGRS